MFKIDPDTVRMIIEKARVFDAAMDNGQEDEELATGSVHTTDELLEDHDLEDATEDDPLFDELREIIHELNVDDQIELVALAWLGRASYGVEEWDQAIEEAARAHNERTAEYLLGMPMLADYLAEGLAAFGESIES